MTLSNPAGYESSCNSQGLANPLTQLLRWHWNGFQCAGDLTRSDALLQAMLRGVRETGATARKEAVEQFLPHGVTVVLVLSESHFIVSTWPEHQFASIDIGLCSDKVDPALLSQPLVELLAPVHVDTSGSTTRLTSADARHSSEQTF